MLEVRSLESLFWQQYSAGGLRPVRPLFSIVPNTDTRHHTKGNLPGFKQGFSVVVFVFARTCLPLHEICPACSWAEDARPPWPSVTQCDFSCSMTSLEAFTLIPADPLWPLTVCTHMWKTYRIHKESSRLYLHFLHCPRSQVGFDKCLLNWITYWLRLITSYYICLRVSFFSPLSSKKNLQLKCNMV